MAAFRLASKGKTMADSSYEQEVQSILAFLSMQHPAPAPMLSADQLNFQPEDFVAPRIIRKLKIKQVCDYNTKFNVHVNLSQSSTSESII